tara:strand:+ start:1272 stop:1418 length:147 start_codon:yes stop_codon:yes gene_type:complete
MIRFPKRLDSQFNEQKGPLQTDAVYAMLSSVFRGRRHAYPQDSNRDYR